MRAIFVPGLVVALLLSSCVGVPDKLPAPSLDAQAPLDGLAGSEEAAWPDDNWWARYGDAQLDALVAEALGGSSSLAVAGSRFVEAQQAARVQAAISGIRLGGSAQYSRQRLSEHGLFPTQFLGFTWYGQADLGLRLSYDFDWWGRNRASVQAAIGQAHATLAEQAAARIAVEATVVQIYFAWQADQARLALSRQRIEAAEQLVHIAQRRFQAGLTPEDLWLQAKANLAAEQEQLATLTGMSDVHRAGVAALLGKSLSDLGVLEVRPLPYAAMQLPADARIDLIARRPDIAASRWRVESALRETDAARAQFLPDFSLTALAGLSSIDRNSLFEASSRTFALTPALHLPIFNGGELKARYGLSRAKLDSAVAAYEDSVVSAARDVAVNALTIKQVAAEQAGHKRQLEVATALQNKANSRYAQGLTTLSPVLDAKLAVLVQRDAEAELHARALSTEVELIHSLGGGYSETDMPPTADTTTVSGNSGP